MKYKLFVVSDIHGHYDELIEGLKNAGFDKNNHKHKLIVCGDLFDRGNQNEKVFLYLYDLSKKNQAIVLKGNHELFFNDLNNDNPLNVHFNYKYNKFNTTISEFSKLNSDELYNYSNKEIKMRINKNHPELLPWINNLPFYYETKNYLFTHAGIDLNVPFKEINWYKTVWIKSETLENINLKKYGFNKILVMGHRPTILLGEKNFDIHYSKDKQKIYIDGGVAYQGKLNVLVIEDEELL